MFRRSFIACLFAAFLAGLSEQSLHPSDQASPLPLGNVTNVQPVGCPAGFFFGMTCSTAKVENCAGTDSLGFTYGVATPTGVLNGTIVLHDGGGGRTVFDNGYAQAYFQAGYQIVQITWDSDWEAAGSANPASIKNAACRPATFFQYVYTNVYGGSRGDGGMCVHGHSGGAGALAYALTEYDAGSYLDKAMLTSGPVFSDVEAGCMVPNVPSVTICPAGQLGCNGDAWMVPPQYSPNALGSWTGSNACNNVPRGHRTSPEDNTDWKEMSVVDGERDSTFSYPQTALSAWLCSNGQNNSAPQGQLYYVNFTSINQLANNGEVAFYSVNRVDSCLGAEDVWDGTVVVNGRSESALAASIADMTDPVVGCVRRH